MTEAAALRAAIDKALTQISGGLTYFTAGAKHGQLVDAEKTLRAGLRRADKLAKDEGK